MVVVTMNICYFAYPAFEPLIDEVARDSSIEIKYTMSIPANSIQCYDLDNKAIIGEFRLHKGLEGQYFTLLMLKKFFQSFDEFKLKDLVFTQNKTHQKIYS